MYKKFFSLILVAALFAVVVSSCDDDDNNNDNPDPQEQNGENGQISFEDQNSVYVAGREGNVAMLWVNGVAQPLTDGTFNANASSVFVTEDGTVYVAGWENNENDITVATVWIDGVAKRFPSGNYPTMIQSIYVYNGDVYMAGSVTEDQMWPVYWINDFSVGLQAYQGYNTSANSVFVDATGAYIVGSDTRPYLVMNVNRGFQSAALFWENSIVIQQLAVPAAASSVFVSNGDVYIGGSGIWKNGVLQSIGIDGQRGVSSIFVVDDVWYAAVRHMSVSAITGGPVYTSAQTNGAFLSINGVAERLDKTDEPLVILAAANSVYVVGDDVYVAGHVDNIATLWRNGEEYLFGDKTTKQSVATSVFVK